MTYNNLFLEMERLLEDDRYPSDVKVRMLLDMIKTMKSVGVIVVSEGADIH